MLDALGRSDVEDALRYADQLDTVAGPHIQFEEQVFYPQVKKRLGEEFVGQLYAEHEVGRRALSQLLEQKSDGALDDSQRHELIAQFRVAQSHAVSCGSLLSFLTEMDDEQAEIALDELCEFRRQGRRWTELTRS